MTTGANEARETPGATFKAVSLACVTFAGVASKSVGSYLRCAEGLINAKTASEVDDAIRANMRDQFAAYFENLEELLEIAEPEGEDTRATFWD